MQQLKKRLNSGYFCLNAYVCVCILVNVTWSIVLVGLVYQGQTTVVREDQRQRSKHMVVETLSTELECIVKEEFYTKVYCLKYLFAIRAFGRFQNVFSVASVPGKINQKFNECYQ